MNRKTVLELEKIGYYLVPNSKPTSFSNDGGQFCGGYWEVTKEEALEALYNNKKQKHMIINNIERKDSRNITCSRCGSYIDPEVCWCGDEKKYHTIEHNFVPMGCTCYFADKNKCNIPFDNSSKS